MLLPGEVYTVHRFVAAMLLARIIRTLLSAGVIVFHGPIQEAVPFFASQGFQIPVRKAVADFMQEVMPFVFNHCRGGFQPPLCSASILHEFFPNSLPSLVLSAVQVTLLL